MTNTRASLTPLFFQEWPKLLIPVRPNTLERFAAKLVPGDDACRYRWAIPRQHDGYGTFLFDGKNVGAHVASHLMFVGPIPDGYHVDHVRDRGCTHHDCVWWKHLEAVPQIENVRRGDAGLWQAEKTHCKHGHEFTPDNIYWVGPNKDMRQCKTCTKEAASARYRALVNPNPNPDRSVAGAKGAAIRAAQQRAKTHCPHGHEYTEDNLYRDRNGGRACKTCAKARGRARRKAA